MKSFSVLVTVMVMFTMFAGKVYPQSWDCNILDIEHCFPALEDPTIPPTEKCCDEFRQHRKCLCFYKQHYFKLGDTVRACHIDFHDICLALSK